MKPATIETLLSWRPCYDESKIHEWAGGVTEFTAADVLCRDDITPEDRLWVVLRTELIDERVLHEFACWCGEQVLPIWEAQYPNDTRPHKAISAKRAWLHGDIDNEQLIAAWDAAGDAARAAQVNYLLDVLEKIKQR